ncbi:MAG: hypothetical protein EOM77_04565 [Bacteroidia bacterium]|nr:hypothetical protein [Bacteroidia bacterium]
MKNTAKIFVAALSVVFCVSVGRLIIDNKNQLLAEGEPTIYTITLDSTNKYSGLPSDSGTYTPSRAIPWYFDGPCSAPEDGHIKYTYTRASGWNNFWNKNIGDYPTYGIKGIQSVTIAYEFTGTVDNARMYYDNYCAPTASGTVGIDYGVVDFKEAGLSNPVVLGLDELSPYQSNFYLRFRIQSTTTGGSFTIKSLVLTYTCQA